MNLFILAIITSTVVSDACVQLKDPTEDVKENTNRLQTALDSYSCVNVTSGDWTTSGIKISSNKRLVLNPNTRILAVINITQTAVVHVDNAEHVTIEGGGTIYGNAEHAWSYFSEKDDRFSPYGDDGSTGRPNVLLITRSRDIVLRDLHLHNSTDWTLRMEQSRDIFAEKLDIYGDSRFPNNDGFDPVSCENVTLINSRIEVADDGICPKASEGMGPLKDFVVRNTYVRSHSHAIKFGSNCDTNMYNVLFDNVTIGDSNSGMSIQQRSQGNITNITFSNIHVETRYEAPRWWGNGEWLAITNSPRDNGFAVGQIRGLRFINITGRSENGGILSGISGGVHDVLFENVYVKIETFGNYSTGPLPCFQNPVICSNDTAHICVEQTAQPGSEISCLGSRDYRPTPEGNCSFYCRSASKANGIFLENAHDVTFKNVAFEFETPRKGYFGNCIKADERSTRISGSNSIRCIGGGKQ